MGTPTFSTIAVFLAVFVFLGASYEVNIKLVDIFCY